MVSENLSGKYSQKILDHTKQSTIDEIKIASKIAMQKTPEAIGDLTCDKVADKTTKVSSTSTQNISGTVANETENIEHDREIPKEIYTPLEKRQQIINDLRLI